jgi:hypothetical protein
VTQRFQTGLQAAAALTAAVLALAELSGCAVGSTGEALDLGFGVQPPAAVTTPASKVIFSTSATDATASSELAVTWSLQPAGVASPGTIDANGVYTSGDLGTYVVVATSVADPSKVATATVQVVPPSSIDSSAFIPSGRATRWQPGLSYNGGIPTNRTTNCATLSPKGGSLDDTAAIQAALDACPAGQVVKLNAGTFRISNNGVFPKSSTTLRGSGPGVTTLLATGNNPLVVVGRLWYSYAASPVNLLVDAPKEGYSVTTATNPGWTVGEVVNVDEVYDPALTWFNTSMGQTGDYLGWGENRKGTPAASRPIGQAMEVASVTGSGPYTVTFTTPFHRTYRTAKSAHIVRLSASWPQRTGVGVEDLTLSNGAGGDDGGGGVAFIASTRSWAKHVETVQSGASAILFKSSVLCELRDSFIHSTRSPSPGGGGYAIAVDSYAADNLIENNISWNFNKVIVMRSSGGGNVVGYNYMDDGYGSGYPNQVENGINGSHMTTPHDELFEGNWGFNFSGDSTWGNSIAMTVFRNHLTGLRGARTYDGTNLATFTGAGFNYVDQYNRRAAGTNDFHRDYNFVGNVLGFSGMPFVTNPGGQYPTDIQKTWSYEWAPGQPNSAVPMWKFSDQHEGATAQQRRDSIATMLRYGNWDYATNSQRWHPFPDDGSAPSTTPPAGSTLPPSLYQTVKPGFMGANPWPWVDPTTGATHTLPAKARFDAGTPNTLQ